MTERVDDIAIKAGVNKALIYYYFESKDAILNELLKNLWRTGKSAEPSLGRLPEYGQGRYFMAFMEKTWNLQLHIGIL